jgi:hypothetical protein
MTGEVIEGGRRVDIGVRVSSPKQTNKIFDSNLARESIVSDILAEDGKIAKLFYSVVSVGAMGGDIEHA